MSGSRSKTKAQQRPESTLPYIEGRYQEITRNHRFGVQSLGMLDDVFCPIDGNTLWLEVGYYDDGRSEHGLHCLACCAVYTDRGDSCNKVNRIEKALRKQATEYLSRVQGNLGVARREVAHLEAVLKSAKGKGFKL